MLSKRWLIPTGICYKLHLCEILKQAKWIHSGKKKKRERTTAPSGNGVRWELTGKAHFSGVIEMFHISEKGLCYKAFAFVKIYQLFNEKYLGTKLHLY